MTETRKIELSVKLSSTPYTVIGAGDGSAADGGCAAGAAVTLVNAPLYYASTSAEPAVYKSGIFYFYDGILINGRYRLTNTPSRVGKTPIGVNVTGWANAADCSSSSGGNGASGTASADVSGRDISSYAESMTYTDSASDSSDNVSLTLDANSGDWLGSMMPQQGAVLYPDILGYNWERENSKDKISCGVFVLDDISYSDAPSTLQLDGVSKPADSGFSQEEKETIWQNTSIKRIGETIAARYGMGFSFDADDYEIQCDEQDGTDSSYYNSLCKSYGLILKVYARRLWVYDREKYKLKKAVKTFDRKDMISSSFKYSTSLYGRYTGGVFSYTDSDKDTDIYCSIGGGKRIKTVSCPASSVYDASVKLCAELNNANHGAVSVSFNTDGEWGVSAANCIEITGFGAPDGKYFVDQVTHEVSSSGFVSSFECSLVEKAFTPSDVGGSIQGYGEKEASTVNYDSADNAGSAEAGAAVTLSNAPFYVASTSAEPAVSKSGIFYFYDGILINGRYRLTNSADRCGKLPIGVNVTGWVPAEYCGF